MARCCFDYSLLPTPANCNPAIADAPFYAQTPLPPACLTDIGSGKAALLLAVRLQHARSVPTHSAPTNTGQQSGRLGLVPQVAMQTGGTPAIWRKLLLTQQVWIWLYALMRCTGRLKLHEGFGLDRNRGREKKGFVGQ